MSSEEFVEWQLYYERESFGHDLDRLQIGVLTSVLANIHRDSKRQMRPFKKEDFTINPPPPPYVSPENLERQLKRKI